MTEGEKKARKDLENANSNLKDKKAAQRKIAKNAKEREKIANDNSLSQHDKDLRLKALDDDDAKQKEKLGIDKNATDSQTKKAAKEAVKKAKGEKTKAKKEVEANMSDDRKAERRDRIANVVMNSVGAAGTVAATIAGGPIAGILVHKMAKNVKKAAPGVMNAAAKKFGEFKAADGWGRAEMISNLAMKGAKAAAVGVLAAPIVKFAAPALGVVNKLTSAVGAPLALIGGAALTGKLSQKFSGEGGAQGGGLISRIAAGRGRVVQAGAGAEVPQGATQGAAQQTGRPVAGGKPVQGQPAGAESAKQTFAGPSEAEKEARSDLKNDKKALKGATNERKNLEKELFKGGRKEEDLTP